MDYLRRAASILAFSLITAYIGMFYLDLENVWVYIYLKLMSFGLIPATICFSWIYLWRNESDPFKFLSQYNSLTQSVFVLLNLIRIPPRNLGFFGWTYILMSLILIVVYLTDWAYSKHGFFITGGLILLNVVFAIGLVLTTFESVNPFFLSNARPSLAAISDFIAEVSIMGALLAASSQLYWHEILKKRREDEIIERLFATLDAEG
jgi:hypothetical protein